MDVGEPGSLVGRVRRPTACEHQGIALSRLEALHGNGDDGVTARDHD
jgi:hypothetical protein